MTDHLLPPPEPTLQDRDGNSSGTSISPSPSMGEGPGVRAAVPTIAEMVPRIVEHHHPDQIILFGSHARRTARPDSDADLLVVLPLQGSRRAEAVEIHRLLAGIGLPKDIIVVTPEDVERYRVHDHRRRPARR